MIKYITIDNFQSHPRTNLEFHPGVNAIVGPSDSGKTAILRALRWVVWNRPQGDAFRSNWGGDTVVVVGADDCDVMRGKSASVNRYSLDGLEFKAFGTEVPEEVRKALNLDEVNLQQQLARPFLLDDTPGVVAQHFNRVAHLDTISSSEKLVQRWIREIDSQVKGLTRQEEQYREDLKQYDGLDELDKRVRELERQQAKQHQHKGEVEVLCRLIIRHQGLQQRIEKEQAVTAVEGAVGTLLGRYKQLRAASALETELRTKIAHAKRLQVKIQDSQQILPAENQVESLITRRSLLREYTDKGAKIAALISRAKTLMSRIKETISKRVGLEEEFRRHMPDICPLCGRGGS